VHKFLLEIGVEEIPARFITSSLTMMRQSAERLLKEQRLGYSDIRVLATPRRLTLIIEGLPERQADTVKEIWGPPRKVCFDENGNPTKTLLGFCAGHGISPENVEIRKKERGEYVVARIEEKGLLTESLMDKFALSFIGSLNFPKSMRWADHSIRFVRPIRWILCLLDSTTVEFEIDGIKSGNFTIGHRFLSKGKVFISHPDEYMEKLLNSGVIVDQQRRKEETLRQIHSLAEKRGLRVHEDEELLEEVTYLVEHPWAVMAKFPEEYLGLPPELLITVMRDHQKYFATYLKDGLSNHFIVVSNTSPENEDNVRAGAERVIKARFEDARFYYNEDKRKRLEERVEELRRVVYHEKLGSLFEKTERIRAISRYLAQKLVPERTERIDRTARLSKTDLITGVVREFPELQGIMGYYYALNDGEPSEIALAIKEHYLPRRSGDKNPSTHEGAILSIADRIDNIVSFFGLGLEPTGSEDPFALRRQAIAIIGILRQWSYPVTIEELVNIASGQLQNLQIPVERIINFIEQRVEVILEQEGYNHELISSLSSYISRLPLQEVIKRLQALEEFRKRKEYPDFILAAKRVNNILSKFYAPQATVKEELLSSEHERSLYKISKEVEQRLKEGIEKGDYNNCIEALISMIGPINGFFDNVLVMVKEEDLKNNRLNLLSNVWRALLMVADFSKCTL
jgi:glycyl-tRNA synthetase beta chain